MGIKRYDLSSDHLGPMMVEEEDGDYVFYQSHVETLATEEALLAELFTAVDDFINNRRSYSTIERAYEQIIKARTQKKPEKKKGTFEFYLIDVRAALGDNPEKRTGECFFETLEAQRPDLSERVQGVAQLDPFHHSLWLPAFLEWVQTHWED